MMDVHSIPPLPRGTMKPNVSSPWAILRPQRTYFFQREDGTFFSTDEKEAWGIWSGKRQVIGEITRGPSYMGQSDGALYFQAIKDAHVLLANEGEEAARARLELGIQEEFEVAKKDKTIPRNHDVLDKSGNPINLMNYGN